MRKWMAIFGQLRVEHEGSCSAPDHGITICETKHSVCSAIATFPFLSVLPDKQQNLIDP